MDLFNREAAKTLRIKETSAFAEVSLQKMLLCAFASSRLVFFSGACIPNPFAFLPPPALYSPSLFTGRSFTTTSRVKKTSIFPEAAARSAVSAEIEES